MGASHSVSRLRCTRSALLQGSPTIETDQIGVSMPCFLHNIWNPARYQGGNTNHRYFEGWYFKQVDAEMHRALAVIPGVSFPADGSSKHAFVQIISNGGTAHYFTYPIEAFSSDRGRAFGIRIGDNVFSETGMSLRLRDDGIEIHGDVSFGAWAPWPVKALSPGIMGWYRFVPRMETYHGVLSMNHVISGSIATNGEPIDFEGGRGYVEKDWGRSFPSSWIWAQSNHFGHEGVSLVVSVAKIPWMGKSFVGSIAGLRLDGELYRFTTYTGARLESLSTKAGDAHLILRDSEKELEVRIQSGKAATLKAPTLGAMEGRDSESLCGTIDATMRALSQGRSSLLFQGTGKLAGVEIMNECDELNPRSFLEKR